jgi:RarD protein
MNRNVNRQTVRKAKAALIFSMVIFGSVGILVHYIPLPSSVIAFSRALFGGLFLYVITRLRRIPLSREQLRKNAKLLVLSGALLGFNWIFLFTSFKYTTVAVASICYYMAPIFVVLLSPVLFQEKLGPVKILAVAMAFAGTVLVSGLLQNQGVVNPLGVMYGLLAAVLYAGVLICNKKLQNLSAFESTIGQLASAAVVLAVYILGNEAWWTLSCTPFQFLLLMILSLIVTGFTYALFFGSMPYLPAQTVAIYTYIDPILAVLLSALALHEPLTLEIIAGGILILGATALTEFATQRSLS